MNKNFLNFTFEKCKTLINDISDIYIILDFEGKIEEIEVFERLSKKNIIIDTNKKNIFDIITDESVPKIKKYINLVSKSKKELPKFIEINHLSKDKLNSYPISYSLKKIDKNFLIMIGKDLQEISEIQRKLVSSQLQLEKEYEKYKEFDTKYKILLNHSDEAIIIFDKNNGNIKDINIQAKKMLKIQLNDKKTLNFFNLLKNSKNKKFREGIISHSKTSSTFKVRTKKNKKLILKPIIFRTGNELVILCKIKANKKLRKISNNFSENISHFYNFSPDSIVFLTEKGVILDANDSLIQICNVTSLNDLVGKSFSDLIEKGTTDLNIICEETLKQGKIKNFQCRLITAQGLPFNTNIATCSIQSEKKKIIVISIRIENNIDKNSNQSEKNNENLLSLVGSAPLKTLVSESSDVVEKICIETALKITRNNKAAAADLLEISRQSLYVKLEKYNLFEKNKLN